MEPASGLLAAERRFLPFCWFEKLSMPVGIMIATILLVAPPTEQFPPAGNILMIIMFDYYRHSFSGWFFTGLSKFLLPFGLCDDAHDAQCLSEVLIKFLSRRIATSYATFTLMTMAVKNIDWKVNTMSYDIRRWLLLWGAEISFLLLVRRQHCHSRRWIGQQRIEKASILSLIRCCRYYLF